MPFPIFKGGGAVGIRVTFISGICAVTFAPSAVSISFYLTASDYITYPAPLQSTTATLLIFLTGTARAQIISSYLTCVSNRCPSRF